MVELAKRLQVNVSSVSTLELNDERGVAKTETVDRALDALGLARWDVVLPAERLAAIQQRAERIAAKVVWTMALEAQNLTDEAKQNITRRLVASQIAKELATA
jgi:hypothetical protein